MQIEQQETELDYSKRGISLYGTGGFSLYSHKLGKLLGGTGSNKGSGCRNALIIDKLVSYYLDCKNKNRLEFGDYMYVSFSFIEKDFDLSHTVQQRIFKYFQELELIKVFVHKESGNRRFIKVNLDLIKSICAMEIEDIETIEMNVDDDDTKKEKKRNKKSNKSEK